MKSAPSTLLISEEFAHRTYRAAEEISLHRWDTMAAKSFSAPVASPTSGAKVWAFGLPVKSNRTTMLFVEVCLDCDASETETVANGYRTSFVVEWSGWNTMYFTASSLKPIGQPAGLSTVKRIRLTAGTSSSDRFPGRPIRRLCPSHPTRTW